MRKKIMRTENKEKEKKERRGGGKSEYMKSIKQKACLISAYDQYIMEKRG